MSEVTTSFFYGGASAPQQNTTDELLDQLATGVQSASESASSAASSASNAANSAQSAANSAAAVGTSVYDAAQSAASAEASKIAAEGSASSAAGSATSAASSSNSAASSASVATTKATEASNSASAAATSATNAGNSATSAGTSATNAASSASAAASSATSASGSASTATTQATNAASSATSAAASATTATTQAGIATTKASEAATSATNAANAQTAAESARDATLAAYDSFDDRYLGTKTADPTVDNDGNPLVAGALYFNSVSGGMKVYTGTIWTAAYVDGTGVVHITGDETVGGTKTFTSTITGSISGNAGTATKLATPRSINGTNFDGSANINTITYTSTTATNASYHIPFYSAAAALNQQTYLDTGGDITYNPSTNVLTVGTGNSTNWNTAYSWGNHASAGYAVYPTQTGNAGKYLKTDGTSTSWATVDALPSQSGNSGKYLTTDGSAASWATLNVDPNSTTKGLYEHSNTISANYSITSGNNAMSAGPVSVAAGVSVTVPSGSVWTIV